MSSRAKKKQSKSRDSKSNQHSSPQTSFLTPSLDLASDENLVHTLEEASTKYPSLLGNSALIGQVTRIQNESKGCTIWLSKSAMVASSIAPGSIVSVVSPFSFVFQDYYCRTWFSTELSYVYMMKFSFMKHYICFTILLQIRHIRILLRLSTY